MVMVECGPFRARLHRDTCHLNQQIAIEAALVIINSNGGGYLTCYETERLMLCGKCWQFTGDDKVDMESAYNLLRDRIKEDIEKLCEMLETDNEADYDRIREKRKRYHNNHREVRLAYMRAYRKRQKESDNHFMED